MPQERIDWLEVFLPISNDASKELALIHCLLLFAQNKYNGVSVGPKISNKGSGAASQVPCLPRFTVTVSTSGPQSPVCQTRLPGTVVQDSRLGMCVGHSLYILCFSLHRMDLLTLLSSFGMISAQELDLHTLALY